MNEKLKFSWGHIFAFVALILIAYMTFVGASYYMDGKYKFLNSGFIALAVFVLLFVIFIGAQQVKGVEHKFDKHIKWERFLVFSSPIFFVLLMLPFSHAWTVYGRQGEIMANFSESCRESKQMFTEYEVYADRRIKKADYTLGEDELESWQRKNRLDALTLTIMPANYDSIKNDAIGWLSSASTGTSTWNVFLLGNVAKIENAVDSWHSYLTELSKKDFMFENEAEHFDTDSKFLDSAKAGISKLPNLYMDLGFNFWTILWAVLLYFMLAVPYIIQERHTKAEGHYGLLMFKRRDKASNKNKKDDAGPIINGWRQAPDGTWYKD